MIVLCNGMPRSGSTWSFNVVMGLLRRRAGAGAVLGGYDEDVGRFLTAAGATATDLALKCHQLDPLGRALARTGAAKVVYTHRNLADALASVMRMFGGDFEAALASMSSSLELRQLHQKGGTAVIIAYEEIMGDPKGAVGRIAACLGVGVSAELLEAVAEENSIERTRERVEKIGEAGSAAFDRATLLHPHHIRDGSSGYGRKMLSEEQLGRISRLLGEYGLEE